MKAVRATSGFLVLFVALCAASPVPTAAHPSPARCRALELRTRDAAVPLAPGDDDWYARRDDPATPHVNEAARDIARAIDPAHGALYRHAYDWLTRGGRMIIFVGGSGDEGKPAGWIRPAQEWLRDLARDDAGCAVVPALQIDYRLHAPGPLETPFNYLAYPVSFAQGLARARQMVRKAASAGSRDIWILGHSKGADIVGNAVADLRSLPQLRHGLAFAVPALQWGPWGVRSAVAPDWDPVYRRAGLFKYDTHAGRSFGGKLVVFNKYSDRVANSIDPWLFWQIIDYGHHYEPLLGNADFRRRLRDLIGSPVRSYEDRPAGILFDL